jgi:hypothetical protein
MRVREKSSKETREKRFVETNKVAAEIIDAEVRRKREKTEKLRMARLAQEAERSSEAPSRP